jgi:hypothetical protein
VSRDSLIAKYETLPASARRQVDTFVDYLSRTAKPSRSIKRRFKFDWAGGLADLKSRYSSVELQHQING